MTRTVWRLRRVWLALALLAVALAAWSVLVEPRWVAVRALAHSVPGWQGPAGLKVVVASDWHFTKRALWRVMTVERARRIVAEINAAHPDVVLLPGDLIADRDYRPDIAATPEDEIAQVLGGLKAKYGVFAVLGNHDWWHHGTKFQQALGRNGITVLENQAVSLAGTRLWVAGIGDDFTGHSQPARAVAAIPAGAQALVLMHDPASFATLPPVRGLVVAGHTHGGQVSVPGIGALVLPGRAPRAWAYGWVEHDDNRMYVTSGLGVSIFPVRFNMRPEWALITITDVRTRP
ncbi:MAG: metallophosphoesterase [Comamonadaceae bacterium]|nr:MAG: metallophosphoesterase [Comamonadaceae bacterium]